MIKVQVGDLFRVETTSPENKVKCISSGIKSGVKADWLTFQWQTPKQSTFQMTGYAFMNSFTATKIN